MLQINKTKKQTLLVSIIFVLLFTFSYSSVKVSAQTTTRGDFAQLFVAKKNTSVIAPGSFVPVSVTLLNFGSSARVDVIITYTILRTGVIVHQESETVAVETTSEFIRQLQVPQRLRDGLYTIQTSIKYPDQISPAVSSFDVVIERKFFGLSASAWLLMIIVTLLLLSFIFLVAYIVHTVRKKTELDEHVYDEIPRAHRVFYILLHDILKDMKEDIGKKAYELTEKIEGVDVDIEEEIVKNITGNPSEVIAELVEAFDDVKNN